MDELAPSYAATLDWLVHLEVTRGWDLKLESVREALARLGDPQAAFPSLHVAGTNGKGSTAAFAHSILSRHGLRVGLFTSPHLEDFRERIRIGDRWIEEREVVELADEIRATLAGSGVELTFFELTTCLGFLHFARERVDAAVVEVGLGGRLDATNVVVPRATVVTTIGYDHERWLGTTLEAIAAEKGGIFKPGVPAVVGRVPEEPGRVLAALAAERGAPLRALGRDFRAAEVDPEVPTFDFSGRRDLPGLRSGLAGRFQIDNAAVALAALEEAGWLADVPRDTIDRGLAEVAWPGRLEVLGNRPLLVVDGAHNPAGVAALALELPRIARGRRVHLVFGVLADKRWREMAAALAPHVADAVVVPVPERRSEEPAVVAPVFAERVPTRIEGSGAAAVMRLCADPAAAADVVLVAGSLFLVGEVRSAMKHATNGAPLPSGGRLG